MGGSIIKFECVRDTDSASSNNDRYTFLTLTSTAQSDYCSIASTVTAITSTATYNSISYVADLNKINFKSNTYTANFFTGGDSLIHFEGAPRIFFTSESFTNNGDNTKEALTTYGSGVLTAATSEMTI
jgi:hypothetical protein